MRATLLFLGYLLVSLPFTITSFPKYYRPTMGRNSSSRNSKSKTSLSLFSKIGISAASLFGSYWAITSIFFPQPATTPQFETTGDIPAVYFKEKQEIPAYVVKVTDGDTYRIRHLANKNSREFKGSLTEHTIPLRLAAVDAPEVAKYGQPGQKFADEAKKFAQEQILRKDVTVKLLGKDQYNRVIGLVKYELNGKTYDLSEELLSRGYAVVYRQGGAKYDGKIERWNNLENIAKLEKKGIWKDGVDAAELPSDYKRAMRNVEGKQYSYQR